MQTTDRPQFVAVLNGLAAMKPGASKLTPEALDLWWGSMRHWQLDEFKTAAAHLTRSIEFMPSPFHFEQLRKAGRPTAGEAWLKAKDAAGSCYVGGAIGYGSGGSCGDPFVDCVVRAIGGYRAIAMADSDKLHWLEKRFGEHFEEMQDAEDVREAVPQIAGPAHNPRLNGPRHILDFKPDDAA